MVPGNNVPLHSGRRVPYRERPAHPSRGLWRRLEEHHALHAGGVSVVNLDPADHAESLEERVNLESCPRGRGASELDAEGERVEGGGWKVSAPAAVVV